MKKDLSINQFYFDKRNAQILEALERKYSRDYLNFFETLADMYIKGPKKDLDKLVVLIENTIAKIQDVLGGYSLSKEQADKLLANIQEIEEQKDYWIRQSYKNQALHDRLDKVTEKTGISPFDLNATLKIARAGVKQATTPKSGHWGDFTKSKAFGLGKELFQGAAAAGLGPLYPVAKQAFDVFSDVTKLFGPGASSKRAAKEQSFAEKLSPVSAGLPYRAFQNLTQARQEGPNVRDFYGVRSLEHQVAPLKAFYDKDAFRAKWTKELLDYTKQIAKNRPDGGEKYLGGIASGIKDALFGAMGLTVAGASGLGMAALTIGTVTVASLVARKFIPEAVKTHEAVSDIGKAEKTWKDWEASRTAQQQAVLKKHGVQGTKEPGFFGKILREAGLWSQAIRDIYSPYKDENKVIGAASAKMEAPTSPVITPDKLDEIVSGAKKEMEKMAAPAPLPFGPPTIPGLEISLKEMTTELRNFVQNMQTQSTNTPSPKVPRNVHDAGDVLLQRYAEGNLTLGE